VAFHRAIPARDVRAADLQEKPTKRADTRLTLKPSRFVGFDEDGGCQRTSQRAERAIEYSELGERGNQARVLRR
jgi:hypothetical protein